MTPGMPPRQPGWQRPTNQSPTRSPGWTRELVRRPRRRLQDPRRLPCPAPDRPPRTGSVLAAIGAIESDHGRPRLRARVRRQRLRLLRGTVAVQPARRPTLNVADLPPRRDRG